MLSDLFQKKQQKDLTFQGPKKLKEKPIRSILKALSWRAVGTVDTIIISFLLTGKLDIAFSIGGLELITKTVLYYLHERVWGKLNIGKEEVQTPDYQI